MDNENEGMAGIAHECNPEYHCCVHDECWVGAVTNECILAGTRKDAAYTESEETEDG